MFSPEARLAAKKTVNFVNFNDKVWELNLVGEGDIGCQFWT